MTRSSSIMANFSSPFFHPHQCLPNLSLPSPYRSLPCTGACYILRLGNRLRHSDSDYSCSDEDTGKRRVRQRPGAWYPQVVEFRNYAAKEEERFFRELLAFPWQRGRAERLLQRLEQKFFPKHGLDSFMTVAYRSRRQSTETFSVNSESSAEGRPVERLGLDYPRMAKALSSGMTSTENFRSQRSGSTSAQKSIGNKGFWLSSSSDKSKAHLPSIRTIRAPLGPKSSTGKKPNQSNIGFGNSIEESGVTRSVESLKGFDRGSNADESPVSESTESTGVDAFSHVSVTGQSQIITTSKAVAKPPLLKRRMKLPEKWDGPGGTVVLIDKPKGWTSFAVCEKLRSLVKVQKVGHSGTLDPLATGLLVVCVGKATKLADSYQALPKVYTGVFRLGEATSSGDAATEVKERKPWTHLTDEDIERAKEAFIGDIMQIPPMFSAIKVEGERLYEKARRGEELDIPARRVSIYELELERSGVDRQDVKFRVSCSKGTYVRSLCTDLGRAMGSCAYLTELRREKIGDFSVKEAWSYTELASEYAALFH